MTTETEVVTQSRLYTDKGANMMVNGILLLVVIWFIALIWVIILFIRKIIRKVSTK